MITKEEFERIQILLGKKGKPKPKQYDFAFRGPIVCDECGSAVTADRKEIIICPECKGKFSCKHRSDCPHCDTLVENMKGVKIYTYEYYFCTKKKKPSCSQKAITNKELEKQIIDILNKISIPSEFHQWALEWLKEENKKESGDRNLILDNQQKAYDKCLNKIDRLIDMRADGELTEEEFSQKKEKLSKEKIRLHELLNDIDGRVSNWLDNGEKWFNFARDAKNAFEQGDITKKKAILSALGSKLTLRDKKLCISLQKPLSLIEKATLGVRVEKVRFETAKSLVNTSQTAPFQGGSTAMLRGWDAFRTLRWLTSVDSLEWMLCEVESLLKLSTLPSALS